LSHQNSAFIGQLGRNGPLELNQADCSLPIADSLFVREVI
jgi:hypothetical protein